MTSPPKLVQMVIGKLEELLYEVGRRERKLVQVCYFQYPQPLKQNQKLTLPLRVLLPSLNSHCLSLFLHYIEFL